MSNNDNDPNTQTLRFSVEASPDDDVETYIRAIAAEEAVRAAPDVDEDTIVERTAERVLAEIDLPDGGSGGSGGDGDGDNDLGDDAERLAALIARAEAVLDEFERKTGLRGETFRVGPESITSDPTHSTPMWGIHFATEHDITLGDARISSNQSGTVTFTAYEWHGEDDDVGEVLAETEVDCNGREQTVHLDMDIPAGSEVLLTRPFPAERDDVHEAYHPLPDRAFKPSDDAVSLAFRSSYDGWEGDSQHGLEFYGKGHPTWTGGEGQHWFYLHDLEITADVPTED